MQPARHLEILSERSDALLGVAAAAMETRVPSCPEWALADLVAHMGLVWGWAADTVTAKARAERGKAPEDRAGVLREWAAAQATRLVDTLRAEDPDAECWTFGPPRSVRFWFRRQALETVLHAWDAELAAGAAGRIDPEVAADGVDEHLHVMVPRAVMGRPAEWSGQTVHLHCTDTDGEWTVRLGPNGEVVTERSHAKGDLALRGTAQALWLWCTNRGLAEDHDIERFGDEEIATRWHREIAF